MKCNRPPTRATGSWTMTAIQEPSAYVTSTLCGLFVTRHSATPTTSVFTSVSSLAPHPAHRAFCRWRDGHIATDDGSHSGFPHVRPAGSPPVPDAGTDG